MVDCLIDDYLTDDGSCLAMNFGPSHSHRLRPPCEFALTSEPQVAEDGTSGVASSGAPPAYRDAGGSNHRGKPNSFRWWETKGIQTFRRFRTSRGEKNRTSESVDLPDRIQGGIHSFLVKNHWIPDPHSIHRGYQPWIDRGSVPGSLPRHRACCAGHPNPAMVARQGGSVMEVMVSVVARFT